MIRPDFGDPSGKTWLRPNWSDSAAIDAEGGYWIAAVDGGCVHRFLASGRHDRTVELPLTCPAKPAFCGPGLDRMLVTTLWIRPNPPEQARDAGRIVSLDPGVRGHAIARCRFTPAAD